MPIVTMPQETLTRIEDRLADLAKRVDVRIFAASEVVPALVFNQAEMRDFGGDQGQTMIVAVPDMAALTAAIPVVEDGRANYLILTHPRAVERLDPFA